MSIKNVISPIMIGPSSSHTAGALRIAKFAHNYIGNIPQKVVFQLHGSFSDTYIGHGTDRALLAGIMGYDVDDIKIKESYKTAKDINLDYSFVPEDLGDVHPNTLKILATHNNLDYSITGSSVGAGKIEIIEIDGTITKLKCVKPTLVITNKDKPGVLQKVLATISNHRINIANINLNRVSQYLNEAVCIIELDKNPGLILLTEIKNIENIINCKFIPKI